MVRPRQARLAEAYELILEQCQLEAFVHHHPSAWHGSEVEDASDDDDDNAEVDSADESDASTTTTSSIAPSQSNTIRTTTAGLEDEDVSSTNDWLVGWTEAELAIFFPSLARRSRWFPDLISQDLNHSKSPSQVAHLLSLLKQRSNFQEGKSRAQMRKEEGFSAASKLLRKSRRIGRLSCAHEVSDEWLAFEEEMASQLQQWQDNDDAEEGNSGMETNAKQQNEVGGDKSVEQGMIEEEEEAEADQNAKDGSVISWDDQVINALLFLRHYSLTNADTNHANFLYNVPLSAWLGESELSLYSFSSSVAIQLLISREVEAGLRTSKYKTFSKIHPTPKTHVNSEDKGESLAWRILFRGVELGVLSWIKLTARKGELLPEGRLVPKSDRSLRSTQLDGSTFKRTKGARLMWLDTLTDDSRGQAALAILQNARHQATQRLLNTLTWEEAHSLHATLRRSETQPVTNGVESIGSSQLAMTKKRKIREGSSMDIGIDLSSYSYLERNRIRARFRSRIKRHGKEVAFAMPLDPQLSGRRRLEENDHARKRSRSANGTEMSSNPAQGLAGDGENNIRDTSEEEEEDDNEDDVEDEQPFERLPEYNPQPQRFEQIGVSLNSISSQLSKTAQHTLSMFNISAIKSLAIRGVDEAFDDDANHVEGCSLDTFEVLGMLLSNFLKTVMSSAIEIASSSVNVKGESRKYVTKEQVKVALFFTRLTCSSVQLQQKEEESTSLEEFRSDPPRLYHNGGEKLQEMEIQLHGLKSLRKLPQNQCSMTSDSVVSASDTFTLPIHSTYAPRSGTMNNLQCGDLPLEEDYSDSEESSVYDDSDQEKEIQMRKDEILGVTRESNRLDGRLWDYNERRNQLEEKRWQDLDLCDQVKAQEYEKTLWASVGLEPKHVGQVNNVKETSDDDSEVESSVEEEQDGRERDSRND